jgi:DNA-binding transcriptional ArsR family regulator
VSTQTSATLVAIIAIAAAWFHQAQPAAAAPAGRQVRRRVRPPGAALDWHRTADTPTRAGAAGEPRVVAALDRDTAETYARWFQALSDPTRIVILSYLSRQPGPVSVGTIVTDLAMGQSTVSHHLKALLDVGFVTRTRDRTARLYAVNHNCITQFPTAADVVMGRPARPADSAAS